VTSGAQTRKQKLSQNSLERRERGKLELRQTILEAAVKLFEEQGGFENFSLRQVAEEIGYSATTIYLYFRDKDELLFYVVVEGFREFGQQLEEGYRSSTDPVERLLNIGRAYVQFGLDHPMHYRLMFIQRGDFLERPPPEGFESVLDSFDILQRAVGEAMSAGTLPKGDVEAYSSTLWVSVHGLVSLHLATPYFPKERVLELQELVLHTLMHGMNARG